MMSLSTLRTGPADSLANDLTKPDSEAWHALIARLRARESAEFSVVSEVLPGETHISAWPVGLTRGIRVLFPPPPAGR